MLNSLSGFIKHCALLIPVLFSFVTNAKSPELVLASYEYKKHDRIAALTPMANLISELSGQNVRIELASSPTALANQMREGLGDVAMPNLIGYLEMRKQQADILAIAVPKKALIPGKPGYTSSVIFHPSKTNVNFSQFLKTSPNPQYFVVWPDSASGGLVGTSWLNDNFPAQIANLKVMSKGSHDNVLKAVIETPDSFGVLATNVLLNSSLSPIAEEVNEGWRSDEIPFGPIVCHKKQQKLCEQLTTALMEQEPSLEALEGLIAGWPEFAGSKQFIKPDAENYDALATTYADANRD